VPTVIVQNQPGGQVVQGDMTGCFYELRNAEFADKHIFACAFEFGTLGDSTLARIRSSRAMIFESQLDAYGAKDPGAEETIRHEFRELYFPAETKWRKRALADCRQAFEGICTAFGVLRSRAVIDL